MTAQLASDGSQPTEVQQKARLWPMLVIEEGEPSNDQEGAQETPVEQDR